MSTLKRMARGLGVWEGTDSCTTQVGISVSFAVPLCRTSSTATILLLPGDSLEPVLHPDKLVMYKGYVEQTFRRLRKVVNVTSADHL